MEDLDDDTKRFIARLRRSSSCLKEGDEEATSLRRCFSFRLPIHVSRAPGRIDVMGGFADYSGSNVLLLPTKESCHAAAQVIPSVGRGLLRIVSMQNRIGKRPRELVLEMEEVVSQRCGSIPLRDVRNIVAQAARKNKREEVVDEEDRKDHLDWFLKLVEMPADIVSDAEIQKAEGSLLSTCTPDTGSSDEEDCERNVPYWATYVVSCLVSLLSHCDLLCDAIKDRSLSIVVHSSVPQGQGVSSSASLELATMGAIYDALSFAVKNSKAFRISSRAGPTSPCQPGPFVEDVAPPLLDYLTRAHLCHEAEVFGVGAPCGEMDQIVSACGRKNEILRLTCRPNLVRGHVAVSPRICFWAIATGVKRSVAGNAYTAARVAAFMGKTMIAEIVRKSSVSNGQEARLRQTYTTSTDPLGLHRVPEEAPVNDEAWIAYNVASLASGAAKSVCEKVESCKDIVFSTKERDVSHWTERAMTGDPFHLTELTPEDFDMYSAFLPLKCSGSSFLKSFPGGHGDSATEIDEAMSYPVRAATAHPIQENARALKMEHILLKSNFATASPELEKQQCRRSSRSMFEKGSSVKSRASLDLDLEAMGALMHASHKSYIACGLGCKEADRIAQCVENSSQLYGARLSGGGAGGAVCILGKNNTEARDQLHAIMSECGKKSHLFEGSSHGAERMGGISVLFSHESNWLQGC